jgi:hypothetical protein
MPGEVSSHDLISEARPHLPCSQVTSLESLLPHLLWVETHVSNGIFIIIVMMP